MIRNHRATGTVAAGMLAAALAVASLAAPAAAGSKCTYDMPSKMAGYDASGATVNWYPKGDVKNGVVVCGGAGRDGVSNVLKGGEFRGGARADVVDLDVDGTFKGGGGNDKANGEVRGKFIGGKGNDFASEVESSSETGPRAVFRGGPGQDRTDELGHDGPASFFGGKGKDLVDDLYEYGKFYGGQGADRADETYGNSSGISVFYGGPWNDSVGVLRGRFFGNDGRDLVETQERGFFNGGLKVDTLLNDCGGTQKNVENTPVISVC